MPALEARGQGVLASCEAAPWVINASQGLRMEKALRACSHPPQTALNSGQPLVRPHWEMSQEPGAPWRAPALHNGDASPGSWPGCICRAGWRYVSHPTAAACLCPASSPGTATPDPPLHPQPPPTRGAQAMGSPTGPCRVLPRGWQRPHGQSILRLPMGTDSIPRPNQIFPHPYGLMAHFWCFLTWWMGAGCSPRPGAEALSLELRPSRFFSVSPQLAQQPAFAQLFL